MGRPREGGDPYAVQTRGVKTEMPYFIDDGTELMGPRLRGDDKHYDFLWLAFTAIAAAAVRFSTPSLA
jgi:hypothetical protein